MMALLLFRCGEWEGACALDREQHLPTDKMNGSTSTRYLVPETVTLKPGDTIEIVGHPDGPEPAPVDYHLNCARGRGRPRHWRTQAIAKERETVKITNARVSICSPGRNFVTCWWRQMRASSDWATPR